MYLSLYPAYRRRAIITRHTLVWQAILSLLCLCRLCPVTDISATVASIGVKFCVMVQIGPGQVFSLFGGSALRESLKSEIFGLNFAHLTANILKTVSRSVKCQLKLNTSSTRAFYRCKLPVVAPQGISQIPICPPSYGKYCVC